MTGTGCAFISIIYSNHHLRHPCRRLDMAAAVVQDDVHVAGQEHLDIERCQVLERRLDLPGASRKEIHAPEAPVREYRVPRDENLVLPVEQADRALGVPGRHVNLELVIPEKDRFLVKRIQDTMPTIDWLPK